MIPVFESAWLAVLLDATLKGSAILLAAWGATGVMRRAPAAARHLVWTLALLGMLLLPLLGAIMPAWPVLVLPGVSAPVATPEVLATPAPPDLSSAQPGAPVSVSTGAAPTRAVWHVTPVDWRAWMPLLWAAGAALLLLRLLVGFTRVRWLARRAAPVEDVSWLQLALVLARRLGLARPVTLLRSDRESVPMTWGTVYPVVLLPPEADRWTQERRTVVLAHELAHVRRWDAATQWVAHLALAIHWFNPLVWIAAGRIRAERERACDDAVIGVGTRAADYADHLLDIVRSLGTQEGPVAALAMARRSQFEGRLLAILDRAARRGGVSRGAALGATLLTAAVILPLAALRAAEPASEIARTSPPAPVPVKPFAPPAQVTTAPVPAKLIVPTPLRSKPQAEQALAASPAPSSVPAIPERVPAEPPQENSHDAIVLQLLRSAAARSSSGDKASVLIDIANTHALKSAATRKAFFDAERTVSSGGDRVPVLTAVVARQARDSQLLGEVLRSTSGLASSGDKVTVLSHVLEVQPRLEAGVMSGFLAVVDGIGSNGDRARILGELVDRSRGDPAMLVGIFGSTQKLGSGGDKAAVLLRATRVSTLPAGPVRDAFFAALGTISSDGDYRRVASAVIGAPERSGEPGQRKQGRSTWSTNTELEGSHNGVPSYRLTIRARNAVRTPDRGDVSEILPGGYVNVEDVRLPGDPDSDGKTTRTLQIVRTENGGMQRTFQVNGQSRAWDAQAQAWFSALLRKHSKITR